MEDSKPFIDLEVPKPASRPVKACALHLFRAVRWAGRETAKSPDRMIRVKNDILEAWKESGQC